MVRWLELVSVSSSSEEEDIALELAALSKL